MWELLPSNEGLIPSKQINVGADSLNEELIISRREFISTTWGLIPSMRELILSMLALFLQRGADSFNKMLISSTRGAFSQ